MPSRHIPFVALLTVIVASAVAGGQARIGGVLALTSGESLRGRLMDGEPGRLAWIADAFDGPFVFPKRLLKHVRLEVHADYVHTPGEVRVEMTNGDSLFGDLVAVEDDVVRIDSDRFGEVAVKRDEVHVIRQRKGGSLIYDGPNNDLEWTSLNGRGKGAWTWEGTSLWTARKGADLHRVVLPATETVDLDLWVSWVGAPSFRIAIGCGGNTKSLKGCVNVEVWGAVLVAYREHEGHVEAVELEAALSDDGSLALKARVEPEQVVFLHRGKEIGRVSRRAEAGRAVYIESRGGRRFTVENIKVRRSSTASIARKLEGEDVRGFDRAARTVNLGDEVVSLDRVDEIAFAHRRGPGEPSVVVTLQDGGALRGDFEQIDEAHLVMRVPWSEATVACPVQALKEIAFHDNRRPGFRSEYRLTVGKDRFLGRIDSWSEEAGSFNWRPTWGDGAALLREPDCTIRFSEESAFYVSRSKAPHRIHLIGSDAFPCRVEKVSPERVVFTSPLAKGRRELTTDVIKAVELDPRSARSVIEDARGKKKKPRNSFASWGAPKRNEKLRHIVDAERRDRILSNPRKYKGRAPGHLLVATNGDVLRGRLVTMTDESVVMAGTMIEDLRLPRANVAVIIFLHPGRKKVDETLADDQPLRMEVVLDKETRVTMEPRDLGQEHLVGTCPALGECTVDYGDVVELRLGRECGGFEGFYEPWVLKPMKEPFPADDSGR